MFFVSFYVFMHTRIINGHQKFIYYWNLSQEVLATESYNGDLFEQFLKDIDFYKSIAVFKYECEEAMSIIWWRGSFTSLKDAVLHQKAQA